MLGRRRHGIGPTGKFKPHTTGTETLAARARRRTEGCAIGLPSPMGECLSLKIPRTGCVCSRNGYLFLSSFVCLFVLGIYLSSAAKLLGGDLEDGVRIN